VLLLALRCFLNLNLNLNLPVLVAFRYSALL
jgi:hypothetical protein